MSHTVLTASDADGGKPIVSPNRRWMTPAEQREFQRLQAQAEVRKREKAEKGRWREGFRPLLEGLRSVVSHLIEIGNW